MINDVILLNSAAKPLAHRQLQPKEYYSFYLRLDNIPDIL
jgi:hypothetical protein